MQLRITRQGFDRLAQVDFTKYDSEPSRKEFKDIQSADRLGRTINALPQEFQFHAGEVECRTSFSMDFN